MSFTNFNPTLTLKLIYSILILSQAWLYNFVLLLGQDMLYEP